MISHHKSSLLIFLNLDFYVILREYLKLKRLYLKTWGLLVQKSKAKNRTTQHATVHNSQDINPSSCNGTPVLPPTQTWSAQRSIRAEMISNKKVCYWQLPHAYFLHYALQQKTAYICHCVHLWSCEKKNHIHLCIPPPGRIFLANPVLLWCAIISLSCVGMQEIFEMNAC